MSLDEMIAVLQAAKEGKPIEERLKCTGKPFEPFTFGTWDFHRYEYRVKPTEPREWVVELRNNERYDRAWRDDRGMIPTDGYIKVREVLPSE